MHIWDTGGSERFRTMVSIYYRDAQAAVICYDVTQQDSLESVNYWIEQMQKHTKPEKFVSALAGNKIDALDVKPRMVSREEVEAIADKNGMILCDTSAKTGEGVQELFLQVAMSIADVYNY